MDDNSLTQKLQDMLATFMDALIELTPDMVYSIIVLTIGYLAGRLVKFLIIKLIRYLHKLLTQRFSNSIQYVNIGQSANFIGTAFFWLILIFALLLISDILGLTIIATGMESILQYSPNAMAAILIVFLAVIVGRITSGVIISVGSKVGLTYSKTLGRIAHYLILITAIIIAIDQLGMEVTVLINMIDVALAALLFGAALAFSLGARTSVSNILAAFYVRKMFKVGDYIKIDDTQGRITKIDTTSVILDTETGQAIIPAKTFNESKSHLIKHNS